MSVELVVQSQRFGRAQPPAEEYLQEYADLHLRVVGIWPIRAFVAKLAGAQRFFKVFDITEHELPRGFIEKFQWNTQPVQIMELPLA